jgi:hypothetical protein
MKNFLRSSQVDLTSVHNVQQTCTQLVIYILRNVKSLHGFVYSVIYKEKRNPLRQLYINVESCECISKGKTMHLTRRFLLK